MFNNSNTLTKEEIFRLYEQSEFSDLLDEDISLYKRIKKLRSIKNKFPLIFTILGVGVIAGTASFLSALKKK